MTSIRIAIAAVLAAAAVFAGATSRTTPSPTVSASHSVAMARPTADSPVLCC
ncbi:MAG TPA: hypothetical protein VK802_28215 [Streptosporangiaceae bacterium]|nr:hypothetical protein [Streptosporangiaceae bacterium]